MKTEATEPFTDEELVRMGHILVHGIDGGMRDQSIVYKMRLMMSRHLDEIAAAPTPPAPNMEVVREWEECRKRPTDEQSPFALAVRGDRMKAALSAQAMELAKEIKGGFAMSAEIEALRNDLETQHETSISHEQRAETAQSTVAAQARKIEELERDSIECQTKLTAAETTVTELRAELDRVSADAREHYARLTAEVERLTGLRATDNKTWIMRAVLAESQRDTAREALTKYGTHRKRCSINQAPNNDCDCGFHRASLSPDRAK